MSAHGLRLADLATRSRAAEGTQAALVLLAGGSETARPSPSDPWPGDTRQATEARELASLAARLRVGGLVAPPPVADDFVRSLERQLVAAWPEEAGAADPASQMDAVSRRTEQERPRPQSRLHSVWAVTASWIKRRLRLSTGLPAGAMFLRHSGRASLTLAAVALALAVGGLPNQGEVLMSAPTYTPTVGAVSATPSPGPGHSESSRVPDPPWRLADATLDEPRLLEEPRLLVARAGQGSEPMPAPAPRSTPRADQPSG